MNTVAHRLNIPGVGVTRWLLRLACCAWPIAGGAQDAAEISLHYNPRIPYEYLEDGVIKGLVATPVARAFTRAAVAFHWQSTPVARQFHLVQTNRGLDCLAGRFKNDVRAQWSRYSRPVYRDRPQGLLVRSNDEALRSYTSLDKALRSPTVRLLVKAGYSYGSVIDGIILQRAVAPLNTYDESRDMLRQIHKGMADAFVIAADEAIGLIAQSDLPARDFAFLAFPDAPVGELRYIMCSLNVPQTTVDKLNAAITFKDR